jgi:hypothetical protein
MHHRIMNSDVMLADFDRLFLFEGRLQKADVLYTDPPWGIGAMKYFRTLNKQEHGDILFRDLLARLKQVALTYVLGPFFIEMGLRFAEDMRFVFGNPDAMYLPKYASGKLSQYLFCYGIKPAENLALERNLGLVVSSLRSCGPISSVFDPFIGLGTTAKACKKLGLVCIGNELNRERMLVTKAILPFEEV